MKNSPDPIAAAVAALPGPIALVGFGVEGRETLRFLQAHGARALRVFDRALEAPEIEALRLEYSGAEYSGVEFFGGGDWEEPLSACGVLFRSPGVRPDHPALAAARKNGVRITSATALFLELCPGQSVGVTGTVGKGTTVSLIGEALAASGMGCHLGGNIGLNPLAFLAEMEAGQVAVLELSSFQLMGLAGRRPEVAVVLRTTSEHLDWHLDTAEYRAAKEGLLAPSGEAQTVIHCADSPGSQEVAGPRLGGGLAVSLAAPVQDGIGADSGRLHRFQGGGKASPPLFQDVRLPGRFNLENAAAALLAAEALGADFERAHRAISAFPGLPHRLERVGAAEGVTFYNDSYATRPDATLGAAGAFAEPLALILGGSEKHADFAPLCEALCRHSSLRRAVLMGATAPRIAQDLAAAAARLAMAVPSHKTAGGLEEAFSLAREALPGGGVLLFSPACASFDMFPNYKVRGERFRALAIAAGAV